ncbi:MAG: protein adenylyltransferase SelO family protein [Cyanobacteria bacterium P01_D01_bin.105]
MLITQINYHHFFQALQQQFCSQWREDFTLVFADLSVLTAGWQAQGSVSDLANALTAWKRIYHKLLCQQPVSEMVAIARRLRQHNLGTTFSQSAIAAVWQSIEQADDWRHFFNAIADSKKSL